jgi:hypothetical protein
MYIYTYIYILYIYIYRSVFQSWLADVPTKIGRCPPLAGLGLTRPPELSLEQLEKLDKWCENCIGVPCCAEVCNIY